MRFADRPDWIRRPVALALGVAFFGLVFIAGPSEFMDWNDDRGWPRWQGGGMRAAGGVLLLLGGAVFLHCSGLFARVGRGTPVPVEPPRHLVVAGLYRYSRNPIYVAYAAILLGVFLWFGHAALLVYLGLYFAVVQVVIVGWEEPELRRRFGEEYTRYTHEVRRWL